MTLPGNLVTARLELVPATARLVRSAMTGSGALAGDLGASVPASWPPLHLDATSLQFTLDRLSADPAQQGWWMYFIILAAPRGDRVLAGTAGFAGPPSADGVVEIGYSVVEEHQRRGIATEAVLGLVQHALRTPAVQRVVAHTLPGLAPSIGVLVKCGFRLAGDGPEPGTIRYELLRPGLSHQA